MVLHTALGRYQCRARLSRVEQPQPVERIGIPGYNGTVDAYTFSIYEGAQHGRIGPARTRVHGRMQRVAGGTEIVLTIDHGRWDFVVEIGCIGTALILVMVAGLYMLFSELSTGPLLVGLYGTGLGTICALIYWRQVDRDRDGETAALSQLICTTLGAEVVETRHQIVSIKPDSGRVKA